MGIPKRLCQQRFSYMPQDQRRRLKEKIEVHAGRFGLDRLFYGSFELRTGSSHPTGGAVCKKRAHAADMYVHAHVCLLSQDTRTRSVLRT